MEQDFRQYVLLALAVVVPLYLLKTKRTKLLLGWVGLTMTIQVFDMSLITNLPAGRIVGILYFPYAIAQFRQWLPYKPARAWLVNFVYLIVLGAAFGHLWPWPDITLSRPFTLTAPGRTIIYLGRMLCDLSLLIFVAEEVRKPGRILYLGRALVLGATMSALAGLLQFVTKLDAYHLITGLGESLLELDRARGLSGEPRGLGLICAYGVMIVLLGQGKLFRLWPLMLTANLLGLLITYSTSSLVLFLFGIVASWLFFSNWVRGLVAGVVVLTGVFLLAASIYLPGEFNAGVETVRLRMDPDYKLYGIPPGTFGQEIAYRLDVFDASAMLFLLEEPAYAVIGTGPGLVSLPASYHVPPGMYSLIWTPEIGINSLPFHGVLLEIANGGLLGLACWLFQVIVCWMALRTIANRRQDKSARDEWEFAYAIFVIGMVFYAVQVSSSPIWSLFLGIGWAATRFVSERAYQVTQSTAPRFETGKDSFAAAN